MSTNYTDSLGAYMKELAKCSVLSREQEREALQRWRAGDKDALDLVIRGSLPFIVTIARRYAYGDSILMTDLIQEGSIGVLDAAKRFRLDTNVRFLSYAVYWVRARILTFLMNNRSICRYGTRRIERRLFYGLSSARSKLAAGSGDLTLEELAEAVDEPLEDVVVAVGVLSGRDTSLDTSVFEEGDSFTFLDRLLTESGSPEDNTSVAEMVQASKDVITRGLPALDVRERYIISERWLSPTVATLESLGKTLGVSRERVRQLERRAFHKLRVRCRWFISDLLELS